MKYAEIKGNKLNIIIADNEFANNHSNIISVPDEATNSWILLRENVFLKPAVYEKVFDENGIFVDSMKIENEEIIDNS